MMEAKTKIDDLDVIVSDEVLRAKIRKIIEDRPQSVLEKLSKHPLLSLVVGFLLTWGVGTLLTDRIKDAQFIKEKRQQESKSAAQAVNDLSRLMYERRTRAELVLSSIRRGAPLNELEARKTAYDDCYVRWNQNLQATQLTIRSIAEESQSSEVEKYVKYGLTHHFTEIDRILTKAYDLRLKRDTIESEELDVAKEHLQNALDCSSVITNALWAIATSKGAEDSEAAKIRDTAMSQLASRCRQKPH